MRTRTTGLRRRLAVVLAGVVGAAVGATAMLALPARPAPQSASSGPSPEAAAAPGPVTRLAGGRRAAPLPAPRRRVLLAWTPGGLPASLPAAVRDLAAVTTSTVVRGGLVELTAVENADGARVTRMRAGFVVPLDVIAVDPATYPRVVPPSARASFAALAPGDAVLGTTAASLRGVAEGAVLTLSGGQRWRVAAVVDDALIGGAEVAVARTTGGAPAVARSLLLTYGGSRARAERQVRAALPPGVTVRLRGPGEAPFLRHGDAVLPQAPIKARFGEFAYRLADDGSFTQEPGWEATHVVSARVPLLGSVRCHRALLPALRGALAELRRRNLGSLVDRDGYAGCHNPRLVAAGDSVSRHAWGVAVDLNYPDNPQGSASAQDRRLVEVMQRWGFAWGGDWLVPDPAHFEWLRPPLPLR